MDALVGDTFQARKLRRPAADPRSAPRVGIALARDLVRAHGGELTAQSDGLGRGATSLSLPARRDPRVPPGDPSRRGWSAVRRPAHERRSELRDPEPALVDPERPDLRLEGRGGKSEPLRGAQRPGDATAGVGQRGLDGAPLVRRARPVNDRLAAPAPSDDRRPSQLSSTVTVSRSQTMTDRSITFCSSRTLPGQSYDVSRSSVSRAMLRICLPAFFA